MARPQHDIDELARMERSTILDAQARNRFADTEQTPQTSGSFRPIATLP
ncbi:hypothetical protein [Bradyrhizobium manausense]|nr:hypothetical protein [Bradyrhizobium manausense]